MELPKCYIATDEDFYTTNNPKIPNLALTSPEDEVETLFKRFLGRFAQDAFETLDSCIPIIRYSQNQRLIEYSLRVLGTQLEIESLYFLEVDKERQIKFAYVRFWETHFYRFATAFYPEDEEIYEEPPLTQADIRALEKTLERDYVSIN